MSATATRTLLLDLAGGPLSAWGRSQSHHASFDPMTGWFVRPHRRLDELWPTWSNIKGLLAAAQGRPGGSDLSDLAGLRFGLRVDQPGVVTYDFQVKGGGPPGVKPRPELRMHVYLSDARILVGVQGTASLVDDLAAAVSQPVYGLYLGRRSCPPARPVFRRVSNEDLASALRAEPWLASDWYQRAHPHHTTRLRITDAEPDWLAAHRSAEHGSSVLSPAEGR